MKKHSLRICMLIAAGIVAAPTAAWAADIDETIFVDDANFVKPAELGSSWYIRGEIGYNFDGRHDTNSTGNPARASLEDNNFMDKTHYSVGVGYRINPFLRVDANIGRLQGSNARTSNLLYSVGNEPPGTDPSLIVYPDDPNPCNGYGQFVNTETGVSFLGDDFIRNCIRNDFVEYDTTYTMVNAYVDLPKFAGFQPFVGAGLGIGRVSYREETNAVDCVPRNATIRLEGCRAYGVVEQPEENKPFTQPGSISEGVDYRFGYQLAAGVGYDLTENLTLDATYRFTHFGEGDFKVGSGSALAADGYSTHQINVGFRYALF